MMPVDVLLFAMRHEVECGQLRAAASIAEKAAPYLHAKMAPRAEDGDADRELTIRITGGLPDECPEESDAARPRWSRGSCWG